jgi:hypothetical protein
MMTTLANEDARQAFLVLHKNFSSFLRKAKRELKIFEAHKDELFKFFYWHSKVAPNGMARIGRYFILPIFNMHRIHLVLTWDICTCRISLMIMRDLSDENAKSFVLTKSINSIKEISRIKEEGISQGSFAVYKKEFDSFVKKINEKRIFEDENELSLILVRRYGKASIEHSFQRIEFNKSCKEILRAGNGQEELKKMSDSICGTGVHGAKNLNFMNVLLLEEGYPDSQKIVINMQEEEGGERIEKIRTVGWVRSQLSKLDRFKDFLDEEPSFHEVSEDLD